MFLRKGTSSQKARLSWQPDPEPRWTWCQGVGCRVPLARDTASPACVVAKENSGGKGGGPCWPPGWEEGPTASILFHSAGHTGQHLAAIVGVGGTPGLGNRRGRFASGAAVETQPPAGRKASSRRISRQLLPRAGRCADHFGRSFVASLSALPVRRASVNRKKASQLITALCQGPAGLAPRPGLSWPGSERALQS